MNLRMTIFTPSLLISVPHVYLSVHLNGHSHVCA